MRGRKPKPTELKKLTGVRASRINADEPKFTPDSSPAAPPYLGAYAAQEWTRVYPELAKNNVLKVTDRAVLELYCEAYGDYREAQDALRGKKKVLIVHNGALQKRPEVSMKREAMGLVLKYASELGLTPSSRGKMSGSDPAKPGSKLRNLFLRGLKNAPQGS
jgi:P27 family predicted phage terminase small subunit